MEVRPLKMTSQPTAQTDGDSVFHPPSQEANVEGTSELSHWRWIMPKTCPQSWCQLAISAKQKATVPERFVGLIHKFQAWIQLDQYIFLKKACQAEDTKKLQALPGLWCPTPVWVITYFLRPTNTLKRDSPGGSWGSMLTQTKDKRSQGMGSSNQVREMKRHPPLVKEGSSTSNSGFLWPTCSLRLLKKPFKAF